MERLSKFLRSVIPADPSQLLLIGGAVCLTVAPHLAFRPSPSIDILFPTARLTEETSALSIFSAQLVLFSGLATYFVCFFPGRHAVRRIVCAVMLPATVGAATLLEILRLPESTGSVLHFARQPTGAGAGFDWRLWISLPGFSFCVAGLLLIAIFLARLASGASHLPLSLPGTPQDETEDRDICTRVQWTTWVLVGPLFLIRGLPAFITLRVREIATQHWPLYLPPIVFYAWLEVTATFFAGACLLWLMGLENRQVVWRFSKPSEPRYALLGLSFPVGIVLLVCGGQYFVARADWAAHYFGKYAPPEFFAFFSVPDPWLLYVIFGAFLEEMIFRGLLQRRFVQKYGLNRGIFLAGIVWSAYHFHTDFAFSRATVVKACGMLGSRVAMCLILSYVFGWLTLKFGSVIPAGLAHTFYNVFAFSGFGPEFPGRAAVRLGLWAVLALVLFRYWPVQAKPLPEAVAQAAAL